MGFGGLLRYKHRREAQNSIGLAIIQAPYMKQRSIPEPQTPRDLEADARYDGTRISFGCSANAPDSLRLLGRAGGGIRSSSRK